MKKSLMLFLLLSAIILFLTNLFLGSVGIPFESALQILTGQGSDNKAWQYILLESRLPQAVTAAFAGTALALAGLLLQSLFNNPLAGPSILGIDSGASLGVAVVMLLLGGTISSLSVSGFLTIILGAIAGATVILGIILFFSSFIKSNMMLLIIGIMVGYFTSAVISILNFFSSEENVFSYTIWGMGSFSNVSNNMLPLYCSALSVGIILTILLIKPLNALLLGERYAQNLGVNIKLIRFTILVATGLLTAITTAFCGPVSFIGLSVPHISRLIFRTSNQAVLIPATILAGANIALLCNIISNCPGYSGVIPINAITPVIGAPIIIYVIINQKKIQYFN